MTPISGREREGVLERGRGRLGAVRVVGGVEQDHRAAPDDLEPARRGRPRERRRGPGRRPSGWSPSERLDRGQGGRRRSAPGARRRAAGRRRRTARADPAATAAGRRPRAPATTTPNSRPSRTAVASTSAHRRSRTSAGPGSCSASTAVAPGLMIPAFSTAISSGEVAEVRARGRRRSGSPPRPCRRRRWWRPTTPPMPTSTIATSTGASANAAYAIPTMVSKKLSGCGWAASTRWVYGATSLKARTNSSSVSGSPSIADPLVHPLEVGAGEAARAQVERAQQGVDHPAGRGLAVGAGQVDHRVGALRVAEQLGEGPDPVERRLEPGLRPAGLQRVLDLGDGLGEARAGVARSSRTPSLGSRHSTRRFAMSTRRS